MKQEITQPPRKEKSYDDIDYLFDNGVLRECSNLEPPHHLTLTISVISYS